VNRVLTTRAHAGRIADLPTARYAIDGGHADMVGMTRAHIADPHIVAKLMRVTRTASVPASAPHTAHPGSRRSACTTPRRAGRRRFRS
jgi:2,4-dienoyl-CoA reductase-like NADH-dependent reductase (Old Yellow Enzyme family)